MKTKFIISGILIFIVYTFIILTAQNKINSLQYDLTKQISINQALIDNFSNYSGDMDKVTIKEYYENKCDSWNLCKIKTKSLDFSLEGIYNSDEYYCVNTKGRTEERIATTDQHELCHALVDKDYKHFCKGKER